MGSLRETFFPSPFPFILVATSSLMERALSLILTGDCKVNVHYDSLSYWVLRGEYPSAPLSGALTSYMNKKIFIGGVLILIFPRPREVPESSSWRVNLCFLWCNKYQNSYTERNSFKRGNFPTLPYQFGHCPTASPTPYRLGSPISCLATDRTAGINVTWKNN